MKIVQTLWHSPENYERGLMNTGGWRSPEYHWFSWALSCLQIRTFYEDVVLFGDDMGRKILIDQLQLPYTDFQLMPTIDAPEQAWVLCKIYTYSQQKTHFLHIDGDVFIWEAFDNSYLQNPVIGQNIEIDFPFYPKILQQIKQHFGHVPDFLQTANHECYYALNVGVLGGYDTDFFKKYAQIAFDFVERNKRDFEKIKDPYLCMVIEQLLLYQLAKSSGIKVAILHQPVTDSLYPGFVNFRDAPFTAKYIHVMGGNKQDEDVCIRLSKRLRQDYPQYYYHILKTCVQAGVQIENKAYTLPELSLTNDTTYFTDLEQAYRNNRLQIGSWLYLYGKEMANHRTAERVFSQPISRILSQKIEIDDTSEILTVQTEPLKQVLKTQSVRRLGFVEIPLSNLDMVILDAILEEPKTIHTIVEEICVYFSTNGANLDFQNVVVRQVRELLDVCAINVKE